MESGSEYADGQGEEGDWSARDREGEGGLFSCSHEMIADSARLPDLYLMNCFTNPCP